MNGSAFVTSDVALNRIPPVTSSRIRQCLTASSPMCALISHVPGRTTSADAQLAAARGRQ